MSAVNDLEGCTYMSQSLPFGGCKKSGYDRFAGPEGENATYLLTQRDYANRIHAWKVSVYLPCHSLMLPCWRSSSLCHVCFTISPGLFNTQITAYSKNRCSLIYYHFDNLLRVLLLQLIGLRGLCMIRSVCEDLIPFIRNSIPPPMHYPSTGVGHYFAQGLINLFYSTSIFGNLKGIYLLIKYSIVKGKKKSE